MCSSDLMMILYKKWYQDEEWKQMLRDEINNNGPIFYAGSAYDSGGHQFVVDGYRNHFFI